MARAFGGQVLGYRLLLIQAKVACLGTDKASVEDSARQVVKVFGFKGTQVASADFRGSGNFFQADFAVCALALQPFTE